MQLIPMAPAIFSGLGAVGSLFSIFQGVSQASSQAAYAKAAATQAEYNARAQANSTRRRAAIIMARQRALTGASGVQPVGSPLEVMLDSAKEAELQAQQEIFAGKQRAAMYRTEAAGYTASIPWTVLTGMTKGAGSILGSLYGQP